MFKKYKERKESKIRLEGLERERISFSRNMKVIKFHLSTHSDSEKISLLSFILEAIKRDTQSHYLSAVIYDAYNAPVIDTPFPEMYIDKSGTKFSLHDNAEKQWVDLVNTVVITCPWSLERYLDATLNISENGFEYVSSNQLGMYYSYLDMGYLYNGLHHVSVASILKEGQTMLLQYDMTALFGNIHTDGVSWYNSHANTVNRPVTDVRFALLYTLCEMKYELENSFKETECTQAAKTDLLLLDEYSEQLSKVRI